ncbi:unnamed protein product [Durusdinium trenchii]|uniref:Acyltransferase 3 domain-containing protein n=1 Tax=Durusdinium trenchii TaxID=1381693 RepID=A0ABP0I0S7_9DINO
MGQRLESLDGLRWLASFQVVLCHLRDWWDSLYWGSVWTQFFFLLSGFVLSYAEMTRADAGSRAVPVLSRWEYTQRRLRNLYPFYLAVLLISMIQWSHSWFDWQTLVLNLTLLQAWIPIFDHGFHGTWPPTALRWVPVAWFLSVLLFYWQLVRPAAYLAQQFSLRMALLSLLGLWLWTLVVFLCWDLGLMIDSVFTMTALKFGPAGYLHVFFSGVVLARVFICCQGEEPHRLKLILGCGSPIALGCYLCLLYIFAADGPIFYLCHNGGILPLMCLLLLACASELDPLVPLLKSPMGLVLGRISYSQYLIQTNLLSAMREHLEERLGRLNTKPLGCESRWTPVGWDLHSVSRRPTGQERVKGWSGP